MLNFKLEWIKQSREWMKRYPAEFKKALIKGVKHATLYAEGEAKKSFGKAGKLKVRTGHLRRSIKSSVTARHDKIVASLKSDVIYARIHEEGGIIRASSKPYLRFQVGGRWATVKQVTIPKRPFLRPAFEDNIKQISDIIQNTVTKEMANVK